MARQTTDVRVVAAGLDQRGIGAGGGGAAGDAPWPCDPRELGVLGTEPEPDLRKNPISAGSKYPSAVLARVTR